MALQLSCPRVSRLQVPPVLRQNAVSGCRVSGLFGQRITTGLSIGRFVAQNRPSLIVFAKQPIPGKIRPDQKKKRSRIKDNGKLLKYKLNVKLGDTVVVIAGKDKGKVSEVIKVDKKDNRVLLKDVNMTTRYIKAASQEEKGQMIERESFIHSSNVMHWSAKEQVRSRLGHKINDDGKKVRYLIKTGEELPERPYERRQKKQADTEDDKK